MIKFLYMTLIYCINTKSPSSLKGLEKYIFKYLIKICKKIGQPQRLRKINFTILPSQHRQNGKNKDAIVNSNTKERKIILTK